MANVKKTFRVNGMHCAGCAANVERVLSKREGVAQAAVNFAAATVLIEYDPAVIGVEQLREAVDNAGFELTEEGDDEEEEGSSRQREEYLALRRNTIWAAALALPVFVLGMFFMHTPGADWVMLAFAVPVLFVFGRQFFVGAWKQLRRGQANMDTLVAVSTGVSFLFSVFNTLFPQYWTSRGLEAHVYYEAVVVIIALILFGRLLESRAKVRTGDAIRKLIGLQPKTVVRVEADGREVVVAVKSVRVGDVLVVKPGDKIPVDGAVVDGNSFVDESMITGEPVAVEKSLGAQVYAGTINQKGSFRLCAEKVGGATLLAQIIEIVKQAQGSKAPVQRLVDRIAGVFVPVVLALAAVTFVVWMVFGGEHSFQYALLTSVTVLVIACPCALGLATPTAIMVGVGKGAENNILIKDAESLERMHKLTAVVFDKTGTITEGRPEVRCAWWTEGADTAENRAVLAFVESRSEHPLASAIVAWLGDGVGATDGGFESVTGQGVVGIFGDLRYFAGNLRMMAANGITISEEARRAAAEYERGGDTVIYFASQSGVLAVVSIADKIKSGAAAAIAELKSRGMKVFLLTGDNAAAARSVAGQVGIERYEAEVLPADKLAFVERLQADGETVGFVGDGINDSGAMAQADVSIAMGQGTDIAMDVAQITLMTSDLASVPKAIRLSHQTVAAIRQNLFWAFIYNVIGIPLAMGALYPFTGFLLNPMIAAAAMAFSSVSVVTNSLRIRRKKL